MSKAPGSSTLAELLVRAPQQRLPVEQTLRIADQLCQALIEAHERGGSTHRNLTPGNILLANDGTIMLGDGGSATPVDLTRLGMDTGCGTVGYMAPEQALGRPPDARSDLYARARCSTSW